MTKLIGEQKKLIKEAIKKYNMESEKLTDEYKKVKNDIEFIYFESDEEYEEKLSEALFSYKDNIKEKVWVIINRILDMFEVEAFINGYNIFNNLDIYMLLNRFLMILNWKLPAMT